MSALGIIENIEINHIYPSTYNPRTYPENLNGLLLSINDKGLLQPLIVRPIREGFEVVAGSRRLKACRCLGWRKVQCHVIELSDREAFEVSLIENIQRQTLNPLDEAEAFRKYVLEYGWGSVSELSRKVSKSQEYVSKRLRLLKLPKDIQDQLASSKISPSVAEELLSFEDENVRLELGSLASSSHLTMKEVRSLAKILKKNDFTNIGREMTTSISDDYQNHMYFDKNLRKVITVLHIALLRLDEIVADSSEDWFLRQILMEYRLAFHNQISTFVKARRRLDHISNLKLQVNE
ncbi:MAG TPA: ParB/RepB/Spo0J family partition protein [Nitrososphaerales archaeon]